MPPVGHTTPDTVDGDAQTLSCSPTRSGSAEVQCSATSVPFSLHVRENQTYIHRDEHPRIHNAKPIARLETDQHDQQSHQQSHQQTIHPIQQSNHNRCHRDHRTPHRLLRHNTRNHHLQQLHLQHQRTGNTSTINPIPQRIPKLNLGRCNPWRLRNPLQPARPIQLGSINRRP